MNKKIELGKPVEDPEALAVLRTLIKQRRDSVEQFRKGKRDDLADKEEAEIKIIENYLPAGASEEEIDAAVAAAIQETGATSAKDMGKVMKAAMAKLAGKNADGKRVSEKVRPSSARRREELQMLRCAQHDTICAGGDNAAADPVA